ncbi:ParA family protein [Ruminococcaceae bacterium OttesenSCG-928-A16]|nr:ParA family protein [Ruminococcaceae bacterium OttesenSCG-928-A16]
MHLEVIAITNQKGGVGKTTTTVNLGIGLARKGKRVLLLDADPQGSLTASLGYQQPDRLETTLSTLLEKNIQDKPVLPGEGILSHLEGVDLIPGNLELSGLEASMVNVMSRETILKNYLDSQKGAYDYVLIDCMPSLGMITVNALAAADSVIIPVQAHFLPLKGMEQLIGNIQRVRRHINPSLSVRGALLTLVDNRTNFAKDISRLLRENYGRHLPIFDTEIPVSIRAAEASAVGKSIYLHDPQGKVSEAYRNLVEEVIQHEKSREQQYPVGRSR